MKKEYKVCVCYGIPIYKSGDEFYTYCMGELIYFNTLQEAKDYCRKIWKKFGCD